MSKKNKQQVSKTKAILKTILTLAICAAFVFALIKILPLINTEPADPEPQNPVEAVIDEDGVYDSKEDVALYLITYGHLPKNYYTKAEARKLGWEGGNLEQFVKNGCIGGDVYSNFEGKLPKKDGRIYYECDIDTIGYKNRGSRRIIYSNDGLIYYTHNHYETFELLYGKE